MSASERVEKRSGLARCLIVDASSLSGWCSGPTMSSKPVSISAANELRAWGGAEPAFKLFAAESSGWWLKPALDRTFEHLEASEQVITDKS